MQRRVVSCGVRRLGCFPISPLLHMPPGVLQSKDLWLFPEPSQHTLQSQAEPREASQLVWSKGFSDGDRGLPWALEVSYGSVKGCVCVCSGLMGPRKPGQQHGEQTEVTPLPTCPSSPQRAHQG